MCGTNETARSSSSASNGSSPAPRFPGLPAIVDGSEAVGHVETRVAEVACVYPITPSTTMAAIYQAAVADGRTDLWGPAEHQYQIRVNHLLGTLSGGLNGTTNLNLGQVADDGAADALDGGPDLDWFFALGADTIALLEPWERVN